MTLLTALIGLRTNNLMGLAAPLTFYVITTKDKVIAPEVQKLFAARMKAQTTEVAGSNASLVVHAKEVAEVIEKAALAK